MRFAPLSVELIRAQPRLVFWLVVLGMAALWFVLPVIFYASAPGQLGATLGVSRDFVLVTPSGPPLAFWLADIAFRLAGNHLFGLYLLSQACFVVAFWSLFQLGRAIVGAPQSVLAVLLTVAIPAFSFPLAEFGPDVLALPLWGLTLLNTWRVMGQDRRGAWIGLSLSAGLLLMTSQAAPLLLGLLAIFMVATVRGRQLLRLSDPWFALLLIVVLVFPYGLVLLRTQIEWASAIAGLRDIQAALRQLPWLIASALLLLPGLLLVATANSGLIEGRRGDAPSITRKPVAKLARPFVFTFAFTPVLLTSIASVATQSPSLIGGLGLSLMLTGLAIVLIAGDVIRLRRHAMVRGLWLLMMAAPVAFVLFTSLVQPWVLGREVPTMLPASHMAEFFADIYQRRTGQRLPAISGDSELATAISLAARGRPQLLLLNAAGSTSGLTPQKFGQIGGIVVWRANDTAGTPPDAIKRQFPGLVPEVPVAFQRYVEGRQPQLRVGWALVRPVQAPAK